MKAVLIVIAALTFAIAPFLSPEFGGFDPDRYPIPQNNPPVQPIGWAFSIWGIIYLWILAHAGFGLWKHRDDPDWEAGRPALLVSLAVGAIWLPIALVSPIWATLLIWVMLIAALIALHQIRVAAPQWIAVWPVALYAGWLTAASFVSIGLFGAGYGIVFAEFGWAVIALVVATAFALTFQLRLQIWSYGEAVCWGLIGIMARNIGTEPFIAALAGVAALLITGVTVRQNWRG